MPGPWARWWSPAKLGVEAMDLPPTSRAPRLRMCPPSTATSMMWPSSHQWSTSTATVASPSTVPTTATIRSRLTVWWPTMCSASPPAAPTVARRAPTPSRSTPSTKSKSPCRRSTFVRVDSRVVQSMPLPSRVPTNSRVLPLDITPMRTCMADTTSFWTRK